MHGVQKRTAQGLTSIPDHGRAAVQDEWLHASPLLAPLHTPSTRSAGPVLGVARMADSICLDGFGELTIAAGIDPCQQVVSMPANQIFAKRTDVSSP